MTTGLAPTLSVAVLDAIGNADDLTAPTAFWVQLHTGDPGASGTANVAVNSARRQVSFAAASSGAVANDAAIEWVGVSAETYTHFSAWDQESGGTFVLSGTVSASATTAGATFRIPSGSLILTLSTAG